MFIRCLAFLLILLALALLASPARAGGVVTVCDETHLKAALAGGGTVTFDCSGAVGLTSTIRITGDTTIDGSGQHVTISGSHKVRVFAVYSGATLNLNQLTVADGYTGFDYDESGGAIRNDYGCTVNVRNSFFSDNHSIMAGGAISNWGMLSVAHSTISRNHTELAEGGGIHNGGTATISNSTFDSNVANQAWPSGGGAISNFGTLTVSNSTFVNNRAADLNYYSRDTSGGAIYNWDADVTVSNSTFSGNTAYNGGAITNGGFLGDGTVRLRNTIIANSPEGRNCAGTITDGGGNLSYPGTTCPGIHADPKLLPLMDWGGPTQTVALAEGSAALDAADDAICGAPPVNNFDQRGFPRPTGPRCDIGAYEGVVRFDHLPIVAR